MSRYKVPADNFLAIPQTEGIIQNVSTVGNLEVSKNPVADGGLILFPRESITFYGSTIYVRSTSAAHPVTVAFEEITPASGGSGGSSSGTGGVDIATDAEIDEMLGEVFGM